MFTTLICSQKHTGSPFTCGVPLQERNVDNYVNSRSTAVSIGISDSQRALPYPVESVSEDGEG